MGRSIQVDLDHFPLVVTTIRDPLDLADLADMQRVFESLFASGARFATVTDTRRVHSMPSAEFRHAVATWNQRFEAETRAYNVAGAAVIESALIRAAFRTVHWLAPHPSPYAYVATLEEALCFAIDSLEEAGIRGPDAAEIQDRFAMRPIGRDGHRVD